MRKVACPNCEYETEVYSNTGQVCPYGCTVGDFQANYETSHSPPSRDTGDDDGLGELFGGGDSEEGLILLEADADPMKLAKAEKGGADV